MVLLRTCPNRLTKIRFWWLVVHLSKELQWFSSPQDAECLSHVIKIRVWWIMVEFTQEFQCFLSGCRLSYTSGYVPLQNRSKRLPVLRDQKVLPEVRNRPLLLRENFKSRSFKKWLRIQYGNTPFHHFNIRYTYGSKLPIEKLLDLEVGVSCAASRYRFPKFRVQA